MRALGEHGEEESFPAANVILARLGRNDEVIELCDVACSGTEEIAMKNVSPFWNSLLLVAALGVPVEWCAKVIAIAETRNVPFDDSSTGLHFSVTSLVPLALAAAASHRAFKAHGLHARTTTILVTVAVHGWCMYDSEGSAREALVAQAWTGSALAAGLAWIFSAVCISVAAGLLMLGFALVKRWRRSRVMS